MSALLLLLTLAPPADASEECVNLCNALDAVQEDCEAANGDDHALCQSIGSLEETCDPEDGGTTDECTLERLLMRVPSGGPDPALLYLDLDRFKMVNDSLGHAAGDALLVAFAQRVVRVARARVGIQPDTEPLARIGGDEFVLVLDGLGAPSQAAEVAEAILDSLAEPFEIQDRRVLVGCSIGMTWCRGADPDALLRDADLALYHAKSSGRSRCEQFDPRVHDATLRRWQLEGEIRRALAAGEFTVEYQPIVEITDGSIRSVEALVRWNHPVRGRIPPLEFIGIAEETGLVVPLGLEVLRIACRDLSSWRACHPELAGLRVALNVSPRQIEHGNLLASYGAAIQSWGLSPRDFDIEITESVLMDAAPSRISEFQALRAAGHRVHLDDFGTGYCSLGYLRRVRVDALKIDRSSCREWRKTRRRRRS